MVSGCKGHSNDDPGSATSAPCMARAQQRSQAQRCLLCKGLDGLRSDSYSFVVSSFQIVISNFICRAANKKRQNYQTSGASLSRVPFDSCLSSHLSHLEWKSLKEQVPDSHSPGSDLGTDFFCRHQPIPVLLPAQL